MLSPEDFAAYIGADVSEIDAARLALLSREVQALIRARCPDVDVLDDTVQVVALRVAARAWNSDPMMAGVTQHSVSAGAVSQSLSWSGDTGGAGGVWLSKADKALLDSVCGSKRGGAYGVSLIPAYADGRGVSSRPWDEWVWRPYE